MFRQKARRPEEEIRTGSKDNGVIQGKGYEPRLLQRLEKGRRGLFFRAPRRTHLSIITEGLILDIWAP